MYFDVVTGGGGSLAFGRKESFLSDVYMMGHEVD